MKKIGLFIISILLIVPISVSAADTQYKVETLDATISGSTINYNGTMEAGAHAVTCKLYDKDNTEIDSLSSAVDQQKFSDKFENVSKGTYTVSCANYEGGDIKSVEVTVTDETSNPTVPTETTEESKTSASSKNPKTGDNILVYVTLSIVSLIVIGFVAFKLKKEVK